MAQVTSAPIVVIAAAAVLVLLLIVVWLGFSRAALAQRVRELEKQPGAFDGQVPGAAVTPDSRGAGLNAETGAQVDSLIRSRRKIEAIKLYRASTGLGLKESKEAVEDRENDLGL